MRYAPLGQFGLASVDKSQAFQRGPQLPFGVFGGSCAVQFTYGQRSHYLAPGLDQAKAVQIVDWLKKRLRMSKMKQHGTYA